MALPAELSSMEIPTNRPSGSSSPVFHRGWSRGGWVAAVVCLPALVLAVLLLRTPLAVPYVDDFDSVLNWSLEWHKSASLSERWQLLIQQHNEHRIITLRAAGLLSQLFLGSIDLVLLQWMAFACYLLSIITLVIAFKGQGKSPGDSATILLPLSLLLFQPLSYEAFLWSTVSIPTSVMLVCALLVFALLAGPGRSFHLGRFLGALAALAAAAFSFGNGVLVWPVALFCLLLRRQFRWAVLWAVFGGLVVAAYFTGYHQHPGHPSLIESLPYVWRNLLYSLYFMGSAVSFGSETAALLFGGLFLCWLVGLLFTRYQSRNPVLYAWVLFLLGSIAVNALGRAEFGVTTPLTQNRYQFISSLVAGTACATLVEMLLAAQWKRLAHGTVALTLVLSAALYIVNLPKAHAEVRAARQGFRQWLITGTGIRYPYPERGQTILESSIRKGIFQLTPRQRQLYNHRTSREARQDGRE